MVHVLGRLWSLTGQVGHRERAEAIVAAFSGELQRNFFPLSTLLNGAELLRRARQVVVVGTPGAPDTQALLDVLRRSSSPNRVLALVEPPSGPAGPEGGVPPGHPAHGKGMVAGKASAYLCVDMSCLAPITDPADLRANLSTH
jgi:uncharacterized protein YyaL (SSP411 family)